MHPFVDRLKDVYVSMRFMLLTIFIGLFSFGMLLMIGVSYYRMSKNAVYTASNLVKQTSELAFNEIVKTQMRSVEMQSRYLAQLIQLKLLNVDEPEPFITYAKLLLQSNPSNIVANITWANSEGFAYGLGRQLDGAFDLEQITPSGVILTINKDKHWKFLSQSSSAMNVDVRSRPWYQEAKKQGHFVWNHFFPYLCAFNHALMGTGASTPVYDAEGQLRGVVLLAVRMDYFNQFIRHIRISKNSTVNIVNAQGQLITSSDEKIQANLGGKFRDLHAVSIPGLAASFAEYQRHLASDFIFKEQGNTFIAAYRPIPKTPWMIVILAPQNDFIAPIKKSNLLTMALGFIILFIGVLMILKAVKIILKPLNSIIDETDKIRQFKLEKRGQVKSKIKEIVHISDAIDKMKNGLRSFQKYIPETLVRQLIERGEDAKIGGRKQLLAVFFSDIANFTALSEAMLPNKLMHHLCDYFNELSQIIIDNKGTIDKYIGDSIMAFWGAPRYEKYPCHHAAKAALLCRQQLEILNQAWRAENKPTLFTRFGLHYNTAIVGNLGSNEHLNYTAVGDTVNTASRMQDINKFYNTVILVSDNVHQEIKNDYILRRVDCVVLKGKTSSIMLYELLEEQGKPLSFDLSAYSLAFEQGFSHYQNQIWDEAITCFLACLSIYPQDGVARLFIERCERFKTSPPPQPWKGVWHWSEK